MKQSILSILLLIALTMPALAGVYAERKATTPKLDDG